MKILGCCRLLYIHNHNTYVYAFEHLTKIFFRQQNYSSGKPSTIHSKDKLMRSEGIIPIQAGSNKYASQRGMTGKICLSSDPDEHIYDSST